MAAPRIRLEHLPADVLGLTPIARAAIARGPSFAPVPLARRPEEVPRPEERHPAAVRTGLARALRRMLEGPGGLDAPTRVLSSINALEQEGVFAVVTGQQPGLLCSPLYCLYKALQACRLARELALAWGRPVVPIFWNHGDDHDVAEVHHAWHVNRNLDLQKVSLSGLSSGRLPIARIVLDEQRHGLSAVRSLLQQTYGDHPHVGEALELFVPRAGETLVRSMTRALTALCGGHGLVVIEPDWIRVELSRALAATVVPDLAAAFEAGLRELRQVADQVAIDPHEAALVYRVDEEGRRALRLGGEGFRFDGEQGSRTGEELAAEIVETPAEWSAGALLRPLVQDLALPAAAYIGGLGELDYHAELGPLRDAVGVPRVPFVPRVSVTLIDPEVRVSLAKLSLGAREALEARGNLAGRIEDEPLPAVIHALRASAERAARELRAHAEQLAEIDPSLAPNLARTSAQVKNLVEKLLSKAERVHQNSSGKGRRHVRRLDHSLYPRGAPQERVIGPFAYYARWGSDWIEALFAELPSVTTEHVVAYLEEDGTA